MVAPLNPVQAKDWQRDLTKPTLTCNVSICDVLKTFSQFTPTRRDGVLFVDIFL